MIIEKASGSFLHHLLALHYQSRRQENIDGNRKEVCRQNWQMKRTATTRQHIKNVRVSSICVKTFNRFVLFLSFHTMWQKKKPPFDVLQSCVSWSSSEESRVSKWGGGRVERRWRGRMEGGRRQGGEGKKGGEERLEDMRKGKERVQGRKEEEGMKWDTLRMPCKTKK